jgi:hypothetical protein
MSENPNTEANEDEPTLLGAANKGLLDAAEKERAEARRVRNEKRGALDKPLDEMETVLRKLMPPGKTPAGMMRNTQAMIQHLVAPLQKAERDAIDKEFREASDRIREDYEKKAAALSPLNAWLMRHEVSVKYGGDAVRQILDILPATFEELMDHANGENWCGDFEDGMRWATVDGVIPAEKRTYTFPICWDDVPATHESTPEPGQKWTVTFTVPAYQRVAHVYEGGYFPAYLLHQYRGIDNISFNRVEQPVETPAKG